VSNPYSIGACGQYRVRQLAATVMVPPELTPNSIHVLCAARTSITLKTCLSQLTAAELCCVAVTSLTQNRLRSVVSCA